MQKILRVSVWLGCSAKLNPSTSSHRQSRGASQGGNRASNLPAVIGIQLYDTALKEMTASEKYTRSAMVNHQSTAH
ncbi:hypothetical protein TNCV_1861311 [Trichonephila clavipes]|nr:hypothetical protein TNCV_1861311 [Trichonephila clavipes]